MRRSPISMKIVLMASLSLVCLTTLAQYALDDFRIVDGQLYNIRRSVKWETLASPDGDSWSVLVVRGIISTNLIDCDQQIYTSDRDTGPFLANTIPILLKNYPGEVYVGMTSCGFPYYNLTSPDFDKKPTKPQLCSK
jgi:hypothetical protein